MGLFGSFFSKFSRSKASIEDLDEFRRVLIESDLGVNTADEVIELVRNEKGENLESAVIAQIKSSLFQGAREIPLTSGSLTTILIVGVNGTGKTTSVAKIAANISSAGNRVLLGAADTFRAAAVEQLRTWATRIGLTVITGKPNGEPAAVAFDSATRAVADGYQYLVIDTAGRLQNKADLMAELGKIKRVIEKVTPVNEVLLVVDATTGQNGLSQAKLFSAAVEVTGVVLTKLDGSARGGIALAIEHELDLPIKWIGTGESIGDLVPFDPEIYITGILEAE